MNPAFEQIEQVLTQALTGLDSGQTQFRSNANPDKWSIQQIVEHLNLTYRSTQDTMEVRLAKGHPTQARPSLRQHAMQFVLVRAGFFPEGRLAPSIVTPPLKNEALTGTQLIESVHQSLAAADPVFSQAEALFGKRRAITHQILGPLCIAQWRRFHLVHARHHAKQIRAIRRANGI